MSDPNPPTKHCGERSATTATTRRTAGLVLYSAALILITALATVGISNVGHQSPTPETSPPVPPAASPTEAGPVTSALAFEAQEVPVATSTIPKNPGGPSLLSFDVEALPLPVPSSRAALVSFRVDCSNAEERVPMLVNGKVSTNLFLAKGGRVLGQALAPASDVELRCTLLASAPFINSPEFGEDSIPLEASFGPHREEGRHLAATRRLNDATLIEPGTSTTVLSAPIDVPSRLEAMATTVRLTSCTVVGGSRDTGENQCKQSMTGRESSTVRIRIVARWLDADGEIRSRTTLWDETLAVDYNTHHLPWSLRQEQLAEHAPDGADSAVIVVQVESVAGTPVVAHADGTDAVVTIGS